MAHVYEVLTFDVQTVVGPVFIASILNWLFMGTLIMQLYTYYQTFPTDMVILRILVYGLFLVDVAQTAILTHHGWFFIVTTWGDPAGFDVLPWTASMLPVLCGFVSATVQIFYSWRIWILSPNRFLRAVSILIVLIALVQGLAGIITGFLSLHPPTQENLIRLHPGFSLWLAGSFAVDVLITACMTYILSQAKQKTTWNPTETMLTTLMHRVIQTGAASAICAAIDLALFVGVPSTNFHFVPAYILGKVYTNSLMLTLNLRRPTAAHNKVQAPESELNSYRMDDTRGRSTGGIHISRTVDVEATHPDIWTQKDNQEANTTFEHMVKIPGGNSDTHGTGAV
ncbi:hypothetical protein FB451DRAFT_1205619 [Mycena latifolia]|nr:hypothetical protein FB451DRAFT_1205619 [Mycena latifolia]